MCACALGVANASSYARFAGRRLRIRLQPFSSPSARLVALAAIHARTTEPVAEGADGVQMAYAGMLREMRLMRQVRLGARHVQQLVT